MPPCVFALAGVSEVEQRSAEERLRLLPQRPQGDRHPADAAARPHRATARTVSRSSVTGAASCSSGLTQRPPQGLLSSWRPAEDRCHT